METLPLSVPLCIFGAVNRRQRGERRQRDAEVLLSVGETRNFAENHDHLRVLGLELANFGGAYFKFRTPRLSPHELALLRDLVRKDSRPWDCDELKPYIAELADGIDAAKLRGGEQNSTMRIDFGVEANCA